MENAVKSATQQSAIHHWHPMADPKTAEQSAPLVFERAQGVYIYDTGGRRYLDSQGGLWCVNVGHGRKEVKDAIKAQLDNLPYYTTFGDTSNLPVMELAERLTRMLGARGHAAGLLQFRRLGRQRNRAETRPAILETVRRSAADQVYLPETGVSWGTFRRHVHRRPDVPSFHVRTGPARLFPGRYPLVIPQPLFG